MTTLRWQPSSTQMTSSHLHHYMRWVERRHDLQMSDYHDLWTWSTEHYQDFWQGLFDYFEIPHDGSIDRVCEGRMPGVQWFPDVKVNYIERILQRAQDDDVAMFCRAENGDVSHMTWEEVKRQVAGVQAYLRACGVGKGDRVAAYVRNVPEASIAFLATVGLGAVWTSCSPDFGSDSVIDRFEQIQPKVLFANTTYEYGNKTYDKKEDLKVIFNRLDTSHLCVLDEGHGAIEADAWPDPSDDEVEVRRLPFDHPIWILFSSGTTGVPKAITHGHGGVLLEHLKYVHFHNDVHPGERFFWYTTTGWMMWNFLHASWHGGATIVLYDGSPSVPTLKRLWRLADNLPIHHFGTSAPFLIAMMKRDLNINEMLPLKALRSIGVTGAPLPSEGFDYVYEHIKKDVWLCSMSGGTDMCTAFVGGCIERPVHVGQIQCRALGARVEAWSDDRRPLTQEIGELVITLPMPSMPIYFWGDEGMKRYRASYFEHFDGVWRHGDWIEVTGEDGVVIYGRSDATLNRHGIRIGTSEIYRALHKISDVEDALVVNLELSGGRHWMPLFVKVNTPLSDELIAEIKQILRETYTPRHVPDEIVSVPDIPYTISGKKMEAPVKAILLGRAMGSSMSRGAMRNPEAMDYFIDLATDIKDRFG